MSLINLVELTKKTLKVQDVISHYHRLVPRRRLELWHTTGHSTVKALWLSGISHVTLRRIGNFQALFSLLHAMEKSSFLPQVPQWKLLCRVASWTEKLISVLSNYYHIRSTFWWPHFKLVTPQNWDAASVISQQDSDPYHKNRLHLFKHQGQVVTFNRMTKKYFTKMHNAMHNFGWKGKPMVGQPSMEAHSVYRE